MEGIDVLAGLVEIIRDEKKYGAKIEELAALDESATAKLAAAKEAEGNAMAALMEARKVNAEMAAKHNAIHSELVPREAEVAKGTAMLQSQRQLVADRERAITKLEKDKGVELTRRENAVAAREQRQTKAEAALLKDKDDVAALRQRYERLLGNLKKVVGE